MLALARWLSETSASAALRELDWLIPILQSLHILAIAMVIPSLFLFGLRILSTARPQVQSIAEAAHRFASWIWTGLGLLLASGVPLIVAEPQRTLLNVSFQAKMALLALAISATLALQLSLRRYVDFHSVSGRGYGVARTLVVAALVLWCAVAVAGRLIAYTQPN
jgi:putative copper export protein